MAIKKTTAVKKSDPTPKKKSGPPKKGFTPDRFIAGADYGKVNRKTKDYYYEEGGQGMGPLKRAKDMPSLDGKRTVGQVEKQGQFNRSLITPRKQLVTQAEYKKYAESKAAPKKAVGKMMITKTTKTLPKKK
jgi:hypothetical protein